MARSWRCQVRSNASSHDSEDAEDCLRVQFINKVVEISEIMQRRDKCQRSRRNGNSRKFTDRIVDVPVVLKRQCQSST